MFWYVSCSTFWSTEDGAIPQRGTYAGMWWEDVRRGWSVELGSCCQAQGTTDCTHHSSTTTVMFLAARAICSTWMGLSWQVQISVAGAVLTCCCQCTPG